MKNKLSTKVIAVLTIALFLFSSIPMAEAGMSDKQKKQAWWWGGLGALVSLNMMGRKSAGKPLVGKSVWSKAGEVRGRTIGTLAGAGLGYLYAKKRGMEGKKMTNQMLYGAAIGGGLGYALGKKSGRVNIGVVAGDTGRGLGAIGKKLQEPSSLTGRLTGTLVGAGIGALATIGKDKETQKNAMMYGAIGGVFAPEVARFVGKLGKPKVPKELTVIEPKEGLKEVSGESPALSGKLKVPKELTVIEPKEGLKEVSGESPALSGKVDTSKLVPNNQGGKSWFSTNDPGNRKTIREIVGLSSTGAWTATDEKALRAFQEKLGVTDDGKFGSASLKKYLAL